MEPNVLQSEIKQPFAYSLCYSNTESLQRSIIITALFNLFLVSLLGVILRAYPLFSISFPSYKNLLHAHSHFAFGGWIMPVLLALILKYFPEIATRISYTHLRGINLMMFVSAYGMLISFPFQGYALVSISFSTLSIFAGFYQVYVFWRASGEFKAKTSVRFLRAGLFYLTLSAIGPFATGPLIATGNEGTPLYFNSIYFFLHFQYNGWFTFAVLGILSRLLYQDIRSGRRIFYLLSASCAPAYFLSTLWSRPGILFNIVGAIAAILQLLAAGLLLRDLTKRKFRASLKNVLLQIAISLFVVKTILQLLSSIPAVADLAYQQRNFTIAYLHMVLLGFITLFLLTGIFNTASIKMTPLLKTGIFLFIVGLILSESLLVANAAGYNVSIGMLRFSELILLASCVLPISFMAIWKSVKQALTPGTANDFTE